LPEARHAKKPERKIEGKKSFANWGKKATARKEEANAGDAGGEATGWGKKNEAGRAPGKGSRWEKIGVAGKLRRRGKGRKRQVDT